MTAQFKPGDMVMVATRSTWAGWVSTMDKYLGQLGKIRRVHHDAKISTYRIDGMENWWFPEDTLTPIQSDIIKPGDMVTLKPMRVEKLSGSLIAVDVAGNKIWVDKALVADHHPSPGWKVGDKTAFRSTVVAISENGKQACLKLETGILLVESVTNLIRPN